MDNEEDSKAISAIIKMTIQTYRDAMHANKDNQNAIGTLMGRAIKDTDVKPDQYANLCEEAKKIGFLFQFIVFVQ